MARGRREERISTRVMKSDNGKGKLLRVSFALNRKSHDGG